MRIFRAIGIVDPLVETLTKGILAFSEGTDGELPDEVHMRQEEPPAYVEFRLSSDKRYSDDGLVWKIEGWSHRLRSKYEMRLYDSLMDPDLCNEDQFFWLETSGLPQDVMAAIQGAAEIEVSDAKA